MGVLLAALVQISNNYPGDVGIEGHPDVVYVERFDDALLSTVTARYSEVLNAGGMILDTDVPAGSPAGGRSLRITATGGANTGGHLYRNLPAENDRWYIRYYVKYFSGAPYHHTGVWFGGYNPATPWPNPQAGIKPNGDDRMSITLEERDGGPQLDHYNYWMHMRTNPGGGYWGNSFIEDPSLKFTSDQWMCVEVMVKLNNPVTSFNGELACWVNGVQVSNLGLGFPNGSWVWDKWIPSASGAPFEGFQWRNSDALQLNYLWILHYASAVPAGSTLAIKYDHLVVSRSYIGPMLASAPISPSTGGGGGGGCGGGCGSVGLDLMLPAMLVALLLRRVVR